MRPTIRQLEYIVAVAEEANFSRAAARCFVSQPSLSNQVRQLEMHLGEEIFERTPKGVLITEFGNEVIALSREILERCDRIIESADRGSDPLSGTLRLGSVSTVTPYVVPQVMQELRGLYPELDVVVRDGVAAELEGQLERGEIDVLLVPLPLDLQSVEVLPIAMDRFVLIAPSQSELGALPEPIALASLEGAELLLLDDPHCLRGHALDVCRGGGATPKEGLHATSLSALVQLVRHGLGATLLPSLSLGVELASLPDLKIKEFEAPSPGRTLGIAWRRGSPRADGFKLLASIVLKHAEGAVAWGTDADR